MSGPSAKTRVPVSQAHPQLQFTRRCSYNSRYTFRIRNSLTEKWLSLSLRKIVGWLVGLLVAPPRQPWRCRQYVSSKHWNLAVGWLRVQKAQCLYSETSCGRCVSFQLKGETKMGTRHFLSSEKVRHSRSTRHKLHCTVRNCHLRG